MLNLNCLTCGFLIDVEENTENCVCEACNNTWELTKLLEYKQRVQDVIAKVTQDFEKIEKQAEEERERKKADEERKKQTEAYIARRQADAEVERAKNAGKTVIVNGPNVAEIVDNAVSCFVAKDFNAALKGANEVIASNAKNIPAGFIVSFCNEIFRKRPNQLERFINNVPTLPGSIDLEDVKKLCSLFTAARLKLADYEAKILNIVYANANELGPNAVCKFVDEFSPNIISARSNGGFLTGELFDVYKNLAAFCTIPKTCFALLGAIEHNPASPLKNGDYYLVGKSKKFYEDFVTPVGEIINNMKSEKNRPQFQKAFSDKSLIYRQKAKI